MHCSPTATVISFLVIYLVWTVQFEIVTQVKANFKKKRFLEVLLIKHFREYYKKSLYVLKKFRRYIKYLKYGIGILTKYW